MSNVDTLFSDVLTTKANDVGRTRNWPCSLVRECLPRGSAVDAALKHSVLLFDTHTTPPYFMCTSARSPPSLYLFR